MWYINFVKILHTGRLDSLWCGDFGCKVNGEQGRGYQHTAQGRSLIARVLVFPFSLLFKGVSELKMIRTYPFKLLAGRIFLF